MAPVTRAMAFILQTTPRVPSGGKWEQKNGESK